MKLDRTKFFAPTGTLDISEQGWIDLRRFCEAIVYKRVGAKSYTEDIISRALVECAEALHKYDYSKNNQIGGFLYFIVLGCISKEANANNKYILTGDIDVQGH